MVIRSTSSVSIWFAAIIHHESLVISRDVAATGLLSAVGNTPPPVSHTGPSPVVDISVAIATITSDFASLAAVNLLDVSA